MPECQYGSTAAWQNGSTAAWQNGSTAAWQNVGMLMDPVNGAKLLLSYILKLVVKLQTRSISILKDCCERHCMLGIYNSIQWHSQQSLIITVHIALQYGKELAF